MGQFAGAGPESGRIKPPPNYRDLLRAEGITIGLPARNEDVYELCLSSGIIFCKRSTDYLVRLIEIVRDNSTDVQAGDLDKILNLYTHRDWIANGGGLEFKEKKHTLADLQPEAWVSLQVYLSEGGVDVERLVSKPRPPRSLAKLAATGGADSILDELSTPNIPLSGNGPYGFGK